MPYQPQDSMSLWWLADPAAPQRIGTVSLQDNRRKLGLSYAPGWLAGPQSFALSEDLPLQPGLHLPAERDTAAGAVDDARPDQWGERVIRLIERPARSGRAHGLSRVRAQHGRTSGAADIELLAQYLDGAHLTAQRREAMG